MRQREETETELSLKIPAHYMWQAPIPPEPCIECPHGPRIVTVVNRQDGYAPIPRCTDNAVNGQSEYPFKETLEHFPYNPKPPVPSPAQVPHQPSLCETIPNLVRVTILTTVSFCILSVVWYLVAYYTIAVRSCTHPGATFPDRRPPAMEHRQLLSPLLFRDPGCQGLAWNSNTLFFSGTDFIASVEITNEDDEDTLDYTILKSVAQVVPKELKDQGYWHIGDLTFFNGSLMIPIEDRNWAKPVLMRLDPHTMSPILPVIEVPGLKHFPWVAFHQIPGQPAVMYSSESLNVHEIMRHEFPSMKILPSIHMPAEMNVVQGGEFDTRGILHVSTSKPDAYGCNMYEINVSDTAEQQPLHAAYSLASILSTTGLVETEGIAFTDTTLLVNFNFWYFFKGMVAIALK
jgi:hypothetical protein